MPPTLRFDVFTVLPEVFAPYLQASILQRAIQRGLIDVEIHNIRDYTTDRHHVTDDVPYGGGGGMVMKPGPIFAAVEAVLGAPPGCPLILLTPQGRPFTQAIAMELAGVQAAPELLGQVKPPPPLKKAAVKTPPAGAQMVETPPGDAVLSEALPAGSPPGETPPSEAQTSQMPPSQAPASEPPASTGTLSETPPAPDPAGAPVPPDAPQPAPRRIALLCGRYEGVDERVRQHLVSDEISIGDYVITGGELAALVLIDAVSRLAPGVLGDPDGALDDSHAAGLLEYPHYTRPPEFRGWRVPEALLSGDHARISRWRREQALLRTRQRRPDLLARAPLTKKDRQFLESHFTPENAEED